MTVDELKKPLTPIEIAELSTAAREGLTEQGMSLLRRLMFQFEQHESRKSAKQICSKIAAYL